MFICLFFLLQLSEALAITKRDPLLARRFYLDVLYKLKKIELIIECIKTTDEFYAKELVCKMFAELSIEEPEVVPFGIEADVINWCEELLSYNPLNYSGLLAKAECLMKNSFYADARDLLEKCKLHN